MGRSAWDPSLDLTSWGYVSLLDVQIVMHEAVARYYRKVRVNLLWAILAEAE